MEQHRVTHGAVAAVDVGGTTIKGAVVDGAGAFLRERSAPTPAAGRPEAAPCPPIGVTGTVPRASVLVPSAMR